MHAYKHSYIQKQVHTGTSWKSVLIIQICPGQMQTDWLTTLFAHLHTQVHIPVTNTFGTHWKLVLIIQICLWQTYTDRPPYFHTHMCAHTHTCYRHNCGTHNWDPLNQCWSFRSVQKQTHTGWLTTLFCTCLHTHDIMDSFESVLIIQICPKKATDYVNYSSIQLCIENAKKGLLASLQCSSSTRSEMLYISVVLDHLSIIFKPKLTAEVLHLAIPEELLVCFSDKISLVLILIKTPPTISLHSLYPSQWWLFWFWMNWQWIAPMDMPSTWKNFELTLRVQRETNCASISNTSTLVTQVWQYKPACFPRQAWIFRVWDVTISRDSGMSRI